MIKMPSRQRMVFIGYVVVSWALTGAALIHAKTHKHPHAKVTPDATRTAD